MINSVKNVMEDDYILRNILSHLIQRREVIRTRRVSRTFRAACDSLESCDFTPRVILACSESGKVLDLQPLSRCMVTAMGQWVQKKSSTSLSSGSKIKEPNWITGMCMNPQDRDIYALQYRCPGVIRFSGNNSMRYKHIAFKHPRLEVSGSWHGNYPCIGA